MLALDRGNELHLFEGLPEEWTKPGMESQLNGIATPFGPLYLNFKVDDSGKYVNIKVEKLQDEKLEKIVIHQSTWSENSEEIVFDRNESIDIRILL